MNCSICEKELNNYLERKLTPDLMKEMRQHLEHCRSCQDLYDVLLSIDQLIMEDKKIVPSSDLTNRVMNSIRPVSMIIRIETKFQRVLQPLLIAASITLAVLGGMTIGNIYSSTKSAQKVPIELALMDDLSMESFDMITQ
jgi:predicted anti-sigma-YlaC factor YlaD